MKRFAIKDLQIWSKTKKPKPLIIRGARQVGKSTLVKIFCEQSGYDLLEINLEKTKIHEINNETNFSIKKVLAEIELITQKKIHQKTILFLDEIQNQPLAFNRLRYFYEDAPGLLVIAAGSLLDVIIDEEKYSMPVGRVDYYYLGPLTFSEFLMAKNETVLLDQLNAITLKTPVSMALHERSIELLKEFYFVGGMPEAVKTFVDTGDMSKVREVHRLLLQTYRDDIPKYTKNKQGVRVKEVFDFVPAHLGEGKIKFNSISETNSNLVKEAINILDKAMVIIKVLHNNASGLPLAAGADAATMKLYFLDVGLYNAAAEVQWRDLFHSDEEALLTKGSMAEQFVAQHLKYRSSKVGEGLYYWLRGGKKPAAEIDFLVSLFGQILPIEVKAGSTGKMRSLWQFMSEKKSKMALKLDLKHREQFISNFSQKVITTNGTKEISGTLLSMPLYSIEFISKLIEEWHGNQ